MRIETQSLLDAALTLPDDERAELSAILADSLGDGSTPSEIEASWLAEARRRLQAVRAGASVVVPSEDVERELDEIVNAAPKSS
ncbi:MAG: addiction module protein [Nannocystaceae bacterium]